MACENPLDHRVLTLGMVHGFANWEVSQAANLDSIEVSESDLHKVAYVTQEGTYYGLISFAPAIWHPISGDDVTSFTYSNTSRVITLTLSSGTEFQISLAQTFNAINQKIDSDIQELDLELRQYINDQINTLSQGISDQIAQEVANNIEDAISQNATVKRLEVNVKDLEEIAEEDNGELTLWNKDSRYYLRTSTEPFELYLPIVSEDTPGFDEELTLEVGGYLELVSDVKVEFNSIDPEAVIHDLRPELDSGVLRTDKLLLLDIAEIPDPNDSEETLDQPIWILTSSNFQLPEIPEPDPVTWDEIEDKPDVVVKLKVIESSVALVDSTHLGKVLTLDSGAEVEEGLVEGFNFKVFALGTIQLNLDVSESFANGTATTIEVSEGKSVELTKISATDWWIEGEFTNV